MKKKPKTLRSERTSQLDPLPFPRGEEKRAPPVRGSAVPDSPAQDFLSPIGGEDQGEGPAGPAAGRARSLRKKATWAEKLLWRRLRNRQLAGYKFRRQHPVGPYDLD